MSRITWVYLSFHYQFFFVSLAQLHVANSKTLYPQCSGGEIKEEQSPRRNRRWSFSQIRILAVIVRWYVASVIFLSVLLRTELISFGSVHYLNVWRVDWSGGGHVRVTFRKILFPIAWHVRPVLKLNAIADAPRLWRMENMWNILRK